MDIEKLIERLRSHRGALFKALYKQDMDDAATALAALQDENTWLRIMREWERNQRIHAEQHADVLLEDCKELNAELEDVPIDRLRELVQADKEGRCVVLPCKVGDTVWYLTGSQSSYFDRVKSERVAGFYWDGLRFHIRLRDFHGNHGTYGYFGKTIFLTREEAEAALRGVLDDSNCYRASCNFRRNHTRNSTYCACYTCPNRVEETKNG